MGETWIRAVVAARVPLVTAVALAVAPPLLVQRGPGSLAALFRLERTADLALTTALGLVLAWTCGLTALFVWEYAPRRLADARWPERPFAGARRRGWYLWWTAPALPLAAVLWREASVDVRATAGLAIGVAAATTAALGVVGLRILLIAPLLGSIGRGRPARLLRRLPAALRDGYLVLDGDASVRVDAGHLSATALLALVGSVYAWAHGALRPDRFDGVPPAPLAYVVVLLTLLVLLLSGVAFFLDRFRFPLTLAVVLWSFAVYGERSDHVFALRAAPPSSPPPVSIEASLEAWAARQPPSVERPPLVVITAGGGGIRAAAWTSRVLTWLQRDPRIGSRILDATGLVSTVSGSSVGAMYVLEAARLAEGAPDDATLRRVVEAASRSSLSETGWGIVFPDFLRLTAPWAVEPSIDRAWALEHAWRSAWDPSRPLRTRWSGWVEATGDGRLPAVVFNAFVVDSGDRLLLSTTRIPGTRRAHTLDSLYGTPRHRPDLDLSTAARLSATFPYVTPVARAEWAGIPDGAGAAAAVGVADGGYVDNQGLLTAIEWLRAVLDPETRDARGRPWSERIGEVILLEIRAFGRLDSPGSEAAEACGDPLPPAPARSAGPRRGWWSAVAGPLTGLLSTQRTTQTARNDVEICLLHDALGSRLRRITIEPTPRDAPLSWHLSSAELAALDADRARVTQAAATLAPWLGSPGAAVGQRASESR